MPCRHKDFTKLLLAVAWFGHLCVVEMCRVIPMKSLKCYSDYNSQVTLPEMCGLDVVSSQELVKQEVLGLSGIRYSGNGEAYLDVFFPSLCHFLIISSYALYLHLPVRPLPPQNLSVSPMTSGDFLLTWQTASGSQGLGSALDYEVTYKRQWESWEEAASLLLSSTTQCSLRPEDLVPGSSYVARVRARPGQASSFSGQYSEWSTEVSWKTPEGGLQPRNLRCLFNGGDRLTCSWEVKKVITTSVLFGLFFRATPASQEEECSPVHEKTLPHTPYVVQSCEIPVSNSSSQSQYHVSVRAKTEEKMIEAYKNSEFLFQVLPPANVSVTATGSQEYELRWKKHNMKYSFISQRYQVLNISNDEPPFIFTLQMLAASTEYRGKMRARVNKPPDYEGPWSEWSEEFTWKTENGTFHASVRFCITYCLSWDWSEVQPWPSWSHLPRQLPCLHPCSTSTMLGKEVNDLLSFFLACLHKVNTTNHKVFHVENESKTSCPKDYDCFLIPRAGHSFPISRRNSADASIASHTAISCFAFNGPYLYSPVVSSHPDIHQTLEMDPVGLSKKSVSLQYVTLPREDSPQAPQSQEQPEAAPPRDVLPDQKEMMQHLSDKEEVSQASPPRGEGTNEGTEEQNSPKALSCTTSPQQYPLEYITTDSLVLPSASTSTHPPLATAEESPCGSQQPQRPSDHSWHESSQGKTDVVIPVSGQAPASSPELHLDTFGDYLTLPEGLREHSKPTKISLPVLQKENGIPRKQPLSVGNLVVLNPDSTEPEKDVWKREKIQAIQLFKNLKSDDYFSWQQSLRIKEIC
uniref:Uncharacterized protein n=1 Tax=Geospiza parvula TaxID=87175 RepID=A0A8C3NS92_GEOPR